MRKKITIVILSLLLACATFVSGSFAWLGESNEISPKIDSGVIRQYFERGSGTEADPFIIHTPRHLYNMAWLQYLGMFNQENADGQAKQFYFELCADASECTYDGNAIQESLDMDGWVLPPIGTPQYPFIGSFKGNGVTISNLTVSNKWEDMSDVALDETNFNSASYGSGGTGCDIVGVFGVIGNTPNTSYSYDTSANEVSGLYLDGITVKTDSEKSLIGIAAGYVNGTVQDIGISNSKLDIADGVASLDSDNITDRVSDYTVAGYCEDDYKNSIDLVTVEQGKPEVKISRFDASDTGDAWGGSIAMENLYSRLSGMYDLSSNVTYPTTQKVFIDANGERTVEDGEYDGVNQYIRYYDDSDKDSETNSGRVSFSTRSGGGKSFILMYGEKEINAEKTITTTEYSHPDAYIIADGEYYFCADGNAEIVSIPMDTGDGSVPQTSKWMFEDEDYGYLSTVIDGDKYYLNRNGEEIVLEETPDTIWELDGTEICCQSEMIIYYLVCNNGTWGLSPNAIDTSSVFITDETHYLTYSGGLKDGTRDEATEWELVGANDGLYYIRIKGQNRYLRNNNGTLTTTTNTGNSGTTWNYADGEFTSGEYHLVYNENDGVWKVQIPPTYYVLGNNNGQYIAINSSKNGVEITDYDGATKWSVDNNNRYYFKDGNTTYYLRRSSSNITITTSTAVATAFSVNTNQYLYTGTNRYIYPNGNTWTNSANGGATATRVKRTMNYADLPPVYIRSANKISMGKLVVSGEGVVEDQITIETVVTEPQASTYLTPDSFVPIAASSSANEGYAVKRNNTGYIISGAQYTSPSHENTLQDSGDIRVSSDFFTYDKLSFSNNDQTNKLYSAKGGMNLEVVTRTANSNGFVRIRDSYNANNNSINATLSRAYPNKIDFTTLGLQKYEASRDTLHNNLNSSRTGYLYGLHFMDASISKENCVTIPHAVINNEDYYDLDMPRDCIDFTLKEKGFINFFAGSYFTNNDTFFSLHQIFRDEETKEITAIRQIQKVYKTDTGEYAYLYSDSNNNICSDGRTHSASDLVFDLDWIMHPELGGCVGTSQNGYRGALYYFEVPANSGEYALGSVDGGTGAYLIYLDISANAQEILEQRSEEVTTTTLGSYEYPAGIQVIESGSKSAIDDSDSVAVPVNSGNGNTVELVRSGNTVIVSGADKTSYSDLDVNVIDSDGNEIHATGLNTQVVSNLKITDELYNTTMRTRKTIRTEIVEGTDVERSYTQYIDDEVNSDAEDDGMDIPEQETCIAYRYVLPEDADVENRFILENLDDETGILKNISADDFPAMGAPAIDVSDRATMYSIEVTTDTELTIREIMIADGYTATLNDEEFVEDKKVTVPGS